MDFIDTFQIATMGQCSRNTFTLASNGILVDVDIVDIPVPEIPDDADDLDVLSGIVTTFTGDEINKPDKVRLVTVTATIDGVRYTKSAYTKDLSITMNDINVKISEKITKPTIIIELLTN